MSSVGAVEEYVGGSTSQLMLVDLYASDGTDKTGLAFGDMTITYTRNNGSADVDVTEATMTMGTWATGGFIEVDATNSPGQYQFGVPDAAIADGADYVKIKFRATATVTRNIHVRLIDVDFRAGSNVDSDVIAWTGTATTISSTSAKPEIDVFSLSDDEAAANNQESMYDTSGYLDDTGPASRSLVDAITITTGGAIPSEALDDNVLGAIKGVSFVGVQTSGTFASTEAVDGVYHQLDDTTNTIDIVYSFTISAARQAVDVSFTGRLNSGNDSMNIQAYDFNGTDWETRFVLDGKGGASDDNISFNLLQKHTGTGADLGKVLIRFVGGSSSPTLFVDEILVLSGVGAGSVYNGLVWVDTTGGGTSGTAEGVGTSAIPSDNIADAKTLAVAHGEHEFRIITDSTITLGSSFDKFTFSGSGYFVDLNGQSVSGTVFNEAEIIGNDDGTNPTTTKYKDCTMTNNTLGLHEFSHCILEGTVTLAEAGDYNWYDSKSGVAGTGTPILDFGLTIGSVNLGVRGYYGGLEFKQMGQVGTDVASFDCSAGQLVLASSCVLGNMRRAGMHRLTDNSATVTVNDGFGMTILTDASELVSGISGTINDFDGLNNFDPTSQAVATVTTVTDGAKAAVATEARLAELDAANLPAGVDALPLLAEFATVDTGEATGVDGSVIQLTASDTWEEDTNQHTTGGSFGKAVKNITEIIISSGTLQSSANSYSVVLDASETAVARTYDPSRIVFVGGTGAKQARLIVEYSIDNASRLAILDRDLGMSVNGTTEYIILADIGRDALNDGVVVAATSNTLTFNDLASDVDDTYIDQLISLRAGTNADLTGIIIAYNGTTHVATIHKDWESLPTTGTVYSVGVAGPSGLIDDAITSGKYDEITAFPIVSTDNGATQIARTGADGDTLETISDEIAAAHVTTDGLIAALNDLDVTEVQTAVNAALVALHLDHLLAVDYDPASKPGVSTAWMNELVESNAGVTRYTTAALANAPGGGGDPATGAGQTLIKEGIAALASKDAAAPAYIGGTFDPSTDSNESIRDNMTGTGSGDTRVLSTDLDDFGKSLNWTRTTGGAGISGGTVRIYVTTEYDLKIFTIRAVTTTGDLGALVNDVWLNTGTQYTFEYTKSGETTVNALVTP